MARKKEFFMDYATHAFVRYASIGRPTREEYEQRVREDCYRRLALLPPDVIVNKANGEVSAREPLLKDIDAVNRVLRILAENNKHHIADAIKAVYFTPPCQMPKRGAIVARVRRFAMEYPCSLSSAYRWLKSARLLFAQIRGLDTGSWETR